MASLDQIESLYLHFPYCRHLCNYCDFYKKKSGPAEDIESFHQFLNKSFGVHQQLLSEYQSQFVPLKTLYLGGGTPSLWGKKGADFLSNFFFKHDLKFSPDHEREVTLEVNPGTWTHQGLKAWRDFGVNRYSLGVQSLNSRFLKILDRVHSLNDVYQTLEAFAELNENFSVDFMLGLPFSENFKRDILGELEKILSFGPSHLSLYILTTPKGYIHHNSLPPDFWIEREYLDVCSLLAEHGFHHYEVSNFALEGKESQHNIGYWQSRSIGALGPSATGFLKTSKLRYRWNPSLNWTTKPHFRDYFELETLCDKELRLEELYLSLRTSRGVRLDDFCSHESESEALERMLKGWISQELVSVEAESVIATPKGFLLMDSLMNDLFSNLKSL